MTEEASPLAQLLGRTLRGDVADVRSEVVSRVGDVELERVRFVHDGAERSLVFKRMPVGASLEVQLLPFLARKTDRVPVVHARGIPPPAVPAPRWLLLEDVVDAPSACEAQPRAIVEAKIAVERAVAADVPALRALGVPELSPSALAERIAVAAADEAVAAEARRAAKRLATWPVALAHGDLRCRSAVLAARGVVIADWGRAHLGCALIDVVRLVRDVVDRGEAVLGIGLSRLYAESLGLVLATEVLRAAEKLDRLSERYLERSRARPGDAVH